MIFDIRDFEGTPESLADFVNKKWQQDYGGKTMLPIWSADYFAWHFFTSPLTQPRRILAAYDGSHLLGVCPVEIWPARWQGRPARVSLSSWLTVSTPRPSVRVGAALTGTMLAWAREEGAVAALGWVNSGHISGKGARFWRRQTPDAIYIDRPRLWVRRLSGAPTRSSCGEDGETGCQRGPFPTNLRSPDPSNGNGPMANQDLQIRCYRQTDLAGCAALLSTDDRLADLHLSWTYDRLTQHLCFADVAHTVVAARGGRIVGLANFHVLDLYASDSRFAMMDVLRFADADAATCEALISAVMSQMRDRGAAFAMTLGDPMSDTALLQKAGFAPAISSFTPMLVPLTDEMRRRPVGRVGLLFR